MIVSLMQVMGVRVSPFPPVYTASIDLLEIVRTNQTYGVIGTLSEKTMA